MSLLFNLEVKMKVIKAFKTRTCTACEWITGDNIKRICDFYGIKRYKIFNLSESGDAVKVARSYNVYTVPTVLITQDLNLGYDIDRERQGYEEEFRVFHTEDSLKQYLTEIVTNTVLERGKYE